MSTYSGGVWLVVAAMGLLISALLGGVIHSWWLRRAARQRRRMPKRWPLSARAVANSEERKVWRWLAGAFYDHSIMINKPIAATTNQTPPE